MGAEDKLIRSFYVGFWMFCAFFILSSLALLILAFFGVKIIKGGMIGGNNSFHSKLILIALFIGICLCLIFCVYKFSIFCMDLKDVQQRNFETITGKVIGYSSIGEGNGPNDLSHGEPVFYISETGERIKLSVGPVKLNETYTMIYLRHCKLAEIIGEPITD